MKLLRMLGFPKHRPEDPELVRAKVRSDAVLEKATRVLREQSRIEQLRASFQRAGQRLGG